MARHQRSPPHLEPALLLAALTLVWGRVAGAADREGVHASAEAALGRTGSSDGDDGEELFTDSLQFSSADLVAPTTEASDTMSAGVCTHTHGASSERERAYIWCGLRGHALTALSRCMEAPQSMTRGTGSPGLGRQMLEQHHAPEQVPALRKVYIRRARRGRPKRTPSPQV